MRTGELVDSPDALRGDRSKDGMLNHDFATFLRTQRSQRKLSQTALAARAHISERTLRYWETGVASPGRWEMESILTALELTAQERVLALALLPTPRGVTLSRQEARSSLAQTELLGPMPVLGDLLQAMRLRRKMSPVAMAAELRIARTTILRWETSQSLPSEENLERICTLLAAYPEERAALTTRRMQTWGGGLSPSLEECAEQLETLDKQSTALDSPLIDLRALALKRHLWLLAGRSGEALHLLARVQIVHASWLMVHERKGEAELSIQRSLNILRGNIASEPFWQACMNLAALFASESAGGEAAALRLLKQWLPSFAQEFQAPLWCDMALYAARGQRHPEAAGYLARAHAILPGSWNEQGMTEHYYPLTRSRVLLAASRPHEAMGWLPAIPDATHAATSRAAYSLLWTEALVEANEGDAAQRHLDELRTLFAEYPQPRYLRKFNTLSARL